MGRIRTIKPEFPQSESMGRVSREARLLFVLLWTVADDSGRTRGSSRMLASLLYPYDNDAADAIDDWLSELEAENCIIRYEVDGSHYLQICKWNDHQKIDKPTKSRLPELLNPREPSPKPREPSTTDMDLGPRTKDQEGTKDQDHAPAAAYPEDFEAWWKFYPLKTGKGAALKAFKAALKQATHEQLMEAVVAYSASDQGQGEFCPHPSTWLNKRKWEDDRTTWNKRSGKQSRINTGTGVVHTGEALGDF